MNERGKNGSLQTEELKKAQNNGIKI